MIASCVSEFCVTVRECSRKAVEEWGWVVAFMGTTCAGWVFVRNKLRVEIMVARVRLG